jgi:hypothetical protein
MGAARLKAGAGAWVWAKHPAKHLAVPHMLNRRMLRPYYLFRQCAERAPLGLKAGAGAWVWAKHLVAVDLSALSSFMENILGASGSVQLLSIL